MIVVFAPEKAPKAGDQPRHRPQGRRDCRWFGAVGDDPGGLPFLGIEHHVTGQIRGQSRSPVTRYRIRQAMIRYITKVRSNRSKVPS